MASVQFSYPVLGDGQSQGFFTYSDPTANKYVSFTPSAFAVKSNKLYIKHYGTGVEIYVIFTLEQDNNEKSKASPLQDTITNSIKLNNLILYEMSRNGSKFSLDSQVTYKYTGTEYDFTNGVHHFIIPGVIRAKLIENINSSLVPTNLPISQPKSIPIKPSVGTDDLICDESEVDTTPSTPIYKNTAINVGAVMFSAFVLMGCLMLIKKFRPGAISFDENIGLLKGFENNKVYLIVIGIFFIISFILFIVSGVSKDETKDYSSLFAIIFLVNTIIMMWFKVAVFIPDPRGADDDDDADSVAGVAGSDASSVASSVASGH